MATSYVRMWSCAVVLALLMVASLAVVNADFTNSDEEALKVTKMEARRRILGVHLNDYGEPSANPGHEPKGKVRKAPNKPTKKGHK